MSENTGPNQHTRDTSGTDGAVIRGPAPRPLATDPVRAQDDRIHGPPGPRLPLGGRP